MSFSMRSTFCLCFSLSFLSSFFDGGFFLFLRLLFVVFFFFVGIRCVFCFFFFFFFFFFFLFLFILLFDRVASILLCRFLRLGFLKLCSQLRQNVFLLTRFGPNGRKPRQEGGVASIVLRGRRLAPGTESQQARWLAPIARIDRAR